MSSLRLGILVSVILFLAACGILLFFVWPELPPPKRIEAEVPKWMNDRQAAISITYDMGNPIKSCDILETAKKRGITIDLEFVSGNLTEEKLDFIQNYLLPNGFQFFGHGHEHLNHDRKGSKWALDSAKKCFEYMEILGMHPVAFAYPGGHGSKKSTHLAMKQAGFLSGRGHGIWSKPYIMSGDRRRPRNWYRLPDVFMESIKYRHQKFAINDTKDLKRILNGALDRRAWIILTYHAIGLPDSFGFYERKHFVTDIDEITKRDFWIASMNDITLYTYERENIKAIAKRQDSRWGGSDYISLQLDDGLPDERFDQPLTVRFSIPASWIGRKLNVTSDYSRILTRRFSSATAMLNLRPMRHKYVIRPEN